MISQPKTNHFATARFLGHRKKHQDVERAPEDFASVRIDQYIADMKDLSQKVDRFSCDPPRHYSVVASMIQAAGLILLAYSIYAAAAVITEIRITTIVDERLRLFAKDKTGMRNYAHAFTGADIIHPLTSSTYRAKQRPVDAIAWEPEIVISPGLEAGRCWSFSGPTGHIGISLADRIVITSLSMEHIPLDIAPQNNTAPKDMILWGFVDNETELQIYNSIVRDVNPLPLIFPISKSNMPKGMAAQNFVPLLRFSYDIHAKDALQMFMVSPLSQKSALTVRHIVLDVQTNWGNSLQTCMYHVRIHGVPTHE